MSGGEVRRVSRQDIQLVQNLIERCLQLYMTRKEVVDTLLVQAKIEPDFTELVWQKLEEENKEFFKAYHVRLLVKQQITVFNELLEKQAELMRKIRPAGVGPMPNANGSNTTLRTITQAPACYISDRTILPSRMENMRYPISSNTSSTIISDGPLVCHTMQTASDASAQTQRTDVSSNTLSTQNSQMGMVQGVNSVVIKQEAGYSNSSNFTVGSNHNGLDMHPTIADSPVALLNGVDSNSQQLNDPVDAETSAFGFLGQIPRNFSLSDLTADFNQSSDILESYSRSPFLVTNPEDFLESPGRGEYLGDDNRLDTISEGLSYDEFASD